MSKKIIINEDGKKYTLEFDCDSIIWMEANGFDAGDTKLVTTQDAVFGGSLVKHHADIANDKNARRELWSKIKNRGSLLSALTEMAMQVIVDIMADDEGNAMWEVEK